MIIMHYLYYIQHKVIEKFNRLHNKTFVLIT